MPYIDAHRHLLLEHDLPIRKLVDDMDQNDVEKTVLLGCPAHPRWSLRHIGDSADVLRAAAEHPDRLIPALYTDPRDEVGALAEALRRFHDSGGRVLKMFPPVGFAMDDPALAPALEIMNELKFMVVAHTGVIGHRPQLPREVHQSIGLNSRYSWPMYLDAPARVCPDITFVAAHIGSPWLGEATQLAQMHQNVFVDCSGGIVEELAQFDRWVCRRHYREGLFNKMVWGTEGGKYGPIIEQYKTTFAQSELGQHQDAIFYENGRRLLARHGL